MQTERLRKLQHDPAAFRAALLIDTDAGAVRFGAVAEPFQSTDFAALDPAVRRLIGQDVPVRHSRAWLERGRGHSKTTDIACVVTDLAFASRRKLNIVVGAGDQDQAGLLRNTIDSFVRLNPWLARLIDVQRAAVINPHTGTTVTILSSDAASSYGLTPDVVVCDELTHWKRRDLWDSLFSSAAKRAAALLLVITNAGYQDTWQWELREAVRRDPRWHFHALAGPVARWITADRLDEQRRLLPAKVYARLWLNQWAAGGGDALEEADILASVSQAGALAVGETGWLYVAGLDLGLTRDASALVVLGRHVGWTERREISRRPRHLNSTMAALIDVGVFEVPRDQQLYDVTHHDPTGRLRVAAVRLWRPAGGKVSIEAVENEIIRLNEAFGLEAVAYDPWQAEYLAERLTKRRITTDPVPFVPQNLQSMAQATMQAFGNRLIDLYDDPNLLADLRSLRVVEKSYGIRLDSPRGAHGHGDAATALAIALHSVKRFATTRRTPRLDRPFVVYPSSTCSVLPRGSAVSPTPAPAFEKTKGLEICFSLQH